MTSHDYMKQVSTPLTKIYLPKMAYQSELKGRGRLCYSNLFIWILPLWGKKNGTKQSLKNPQKMIASSLEKKTWQNGNQILNQQIAKM